MAQEFKQSMNLPKTSFSMRAGLAQHEPERLSVWEQNNVYELLLKKNEGNKKFVLHDGPPYANGPIHLGHAMNKISKDIINRYWSMRGYQTPFVPGWDCHGQPIEHKVETMLGTEKFNALPVAKIRELCRKMAVEQVDTQRQGFKRLGVLGEWDNPYLTYVHDYDACDIEIFKALFDNGSVYRGRKPVHWCMYCHTALSEAEIEYSDEVSPAIYVRFELSSTPCGLEDFSGNIYVDIWTTTPWTLPADMCVILHPEATYVAVKHNGQLEIMAEALYQHCCEKFGYGEVELYHLPSGELWQKTGKELVHNTYKLPIFDTAEKQGEFIYADYVTLDDGTGVVHCAPGHGVDDYIAGCKFNIDVVMPVDDNGCFYEGEGIGTGGMFSKMNVNDANPKVIDLLRERGTLILHEDINHSYPHCWRCKKPVIFRATSQWFVSMDKTQLRKQAATCLDSVAFYPNHARKRIGSMVEGRPDWCISRQRNWGVPIPAFTCDDCGELVMNDDTLDCVIALFKQKGSDAWFTDKPSDYLGDACVCPACGSHNLSATTDILDVWWDSGVSHTAVCKHRKNLHFPADMYLEGSDQHRGWFMSSLMTSVGAYGVAPYKAVVSQGFTLDGQGRKMSKSLGNVIDPNKVCDTQGADIIRLWVASVDTSVDVACDDDILSHVGNAYRHFRNTIRFLLGELEDQFSFERDGVSSDDLEDLDKLMLARMCTVHNEVTRAYENYKFNQVYRLLYDFVVVELSQGYLNATKDRMYCGKATGHARKSAQTTWAYLLSMLVRDLQPILVFTCDEAMSHMPASLRDNQQFAALLSWFELPVGAEFIAHNEEAYTNAVTLRSAYTKAYEAARTQGDIAENSTQATRCVVKAPASVVDNLQSYAALDLAELFVCSEVALESADAVSCEVYPARGTKCVRCWNYRSCNAERLCERCADVLASF